MGRDWHPFSKSRKKIDEKRFSRLIQGRRETARIEQKRPPIKNPLVRPQRSHLHELLKEALRKAGREGIDCGPEDLTDLAAAIPVQDDQWEQCEEKSRVIIERFDAEVIRHLKNNPSDLKKMAGHAFEDLLAEILTSLGFKDLSLRVQTVAGEVDILFFRRIGLGAVSATSSN